MSARTPSQLVCQHLENVSRAALEKYQEIVRQFVRGRHGVYALYRGDRLYYVGLASDLRTRLKAHLRDKHGGSWDRFSVYLTIGDSHLREIEALVLRIVRPKGNRQIGRLARAESLKAKLTRHIRECHRREFNELLGRADVEPRAAVRQRGTHRPLCVADHAGRSPVLAAFVDRPLELRARFKGHLVRAKVRRDGSVRLDGQIYNSPSTAAAAACGRRTCDGWTFWKYERAPGDWVLLDELRR